MSYSDSGPHILPFMLNGKTIKDCYEHDYKLVIEFTDGTIIRIISSTIEKVILINK